MASEVEEETRGRFAGLSGEVTFPWGICRRFFDLEAAGLYGMNCIVTKRWEWWGGGGTGQGLRELDLSNLIVCYILLSTTRRNGAL